MQRPSSMIDLDKSPAEVKISLSEVYGSVQGEGVYAGRPTTFIRLQGCPFRCSWCDSPYTWTFTKQHETSVDDAVKQALNLGHSWVCVTGGEPLAQTGVWTLFKTLKSEGLRVECETSGGYLIKPRFIDSWVVDLKCPDSGMESYNKYENLGLMGEQDQLKFVIASKDDFEWAIAVLKRYNKIVTIKSMVLFSPVWGKVQPVELVDWIMDSAPRLRKVAPNHMLSLQQHKVIWPNVERGV